MFAQVVLNSRRWGFSSSSNRTHRPMMDGDDGISTSPSRRIEPVSPSMFFGTGRVHISPTLPGLPGSIIFFCKYIFVAHYKRVTLRTSCVIYWHVFGGA